MCRNLDNKKRGLSESIDHNFLREVTKRKQFFFNVSFLPDEIEASTLKNTTMNFHVESVQELGFLVTLLRCKIDITYNVRTFYRFVSFFPRFMPFTYNFHRLIGFFLSPDKRN